MSLIRRYSAGAAALVFFAMFFAFPLYAAATMCTMPCCHGSAHPTLKADFPACPPSQCSIKADDATVQAVSRYVAPSLVALSHAPAATAAVSFTVTSDVAPSPPPGTPDVRLLSSIFRI